MNKTSFPKKWSTFFNNWKFNKTRYKKIPKILDTLYQSSTTGSWYRVIFPNEPFDNSTFVSWLEGTLTHPGFIKKRNPGTNSGIQLWVSHRDDLAAMFLYLENHSYNIREFTEIEFKETMTNYLTNTYPCFL